MGLRTTFNSLGGRIKTSQKAFVYTVLIPSASYALTLPFNNGTYVNPVDIDWGDGTASTLSSGAYPTHTYATAGSYQIRITSASGKIPHIYFRYSSITYSTITSVDYADVEFYAGATKQTSFSNMFYYCSKLRTIPATLFKNNETATTFANVFRSCTLLETVPDGLFGVHSKVTSFSYAFYSCNKLSLNPNVFCNESEKTMRFAGLTSSISFSNCFYRTSFTGVQGSAPDLWNYTFPSSYQPTKTKCFGGTGNSATSLSNYSSIPTVWVQ